MSDIERRLAAVLAADVAGYSRLAGSDEERTLARLRVLRGDLIDPAIAAHRGRVVKRAGDGTIVEFRSVIDAVRCALEVQQGVVERNHGIAPERQLLFRVGIHSGDVVGEADGDLMGDGVNIAARLEGICEPGGICLSNAAYDQVRDKIGVDFIDLGAKELKNIARPIRVYSIAAATLSAPISNVSGIPKEEKQEETSLAAPRLSVVVLPFANIGGDPEQEYFVDGVTESLTTDLSRISGAFVISRNTAFTYKGKPIDVKQIGRELNVRYVLEGSVQRGGNRLRINVQLIDAETDKHLWAERFDKPVADLFDMQDEIVARLANQLDTELLFAEAHRAERTPHPDSMDLYFQGMAWLYKGSTRANLTAARDLFERALKLDSHNVDAFVGLAQAEGSMAITRVDGNRADHLSATETALTKALSIAPNHATAHYLLGVLYGFTNRAVQAIAELERALSLDRNLASAHAWMGFAKLGVGRAAETEAHVREAFRLSPRNVRAYQWMTIAGEAKMFLDDYDAAVSWLRQAVEVNRNFNVTYFYLAAALAFAGRHDEAKAAMQAGLALNPNFTIRDLRAGAQSDNPTYLTLRERVYDGTRLAGMPEG